MPVHAMLGRPHGGRVIVGEASNYADEAGRLLAAIVAASDDAIIGTTDDGVVTSWNQGAERIFGYTAEEMLGQAISVLAVPGHEDEMRAIRNRLRRGEKIDRHETTRRHKDGSIRHISLTISPLRDAAGRVVGASALSRDITATHLAADALREAQERLQQQHRELLHVARLSELGQMAATLAHEVNQPLSAINNYLRAARRFLAMDAPASRLRLEEAISKAADQAVRAGEIVHRLRRLTRRSESELRPEPIAHLLDEAASLAAIDARTRGVTVQLACDAATDLVLADRVEIQQVLLNLIRNALEAMEEQPRRELRVAAAARDNMVAVSVADTGPGLAPQVAEKLFQPFVTTKSRGVGIGLSICRGIIADHGGRIWAEANQDGGTTFWFTLRCVPAIDLDQGDAAAITLKL